MDALTVPTRDDRCWSRLLGLVAMLAFLLAGDALAQDEFAVLQIEAAFLHKFPTYAQGGVAFDDRATPLVFGIAGSEEVYAFLTELVAAQTSDMRAAEVRRIDAVEDLEGVHVLFVGRGARAQAGLLLQRGVAASMLTVTDLSGQHPPDSMIHFFVAGDRVRFDISLVPAATAGLQLSSRLLQVARQVVGADAAAGD